MKVSWVEEIFKNQKYTIEYQIEYIMNGDIYYMPWPLAEKPKGDKEAKDFFNENRDFFPQENEYVKDVKVKRIVIVTYIYDVD